MIGYIDSYCCLYNMHTINYRGISVMGRVVTWAHAGVDPKLMGIGPIPAIKKAVSAVHVLVQGSI